MPRTENREQQAKFDKVHELYKQILAKDKKPYGKWVDRGALISAFQEAENIKFNSANKAFGTMYSFPVENIGLSLEWMPQVSQSPKHTSRCTQSISKPNVAFLDFICRKHDDS